MKPRPAYLIFFNVYGFIRGAFYARFFCALSKKDPKTDLTAEYYPSIAKLVCDYTLGQLPVFNNTFPFSKGIPLITHNRSFRPTSRALLDYPPAKIRFNTVDIFDTEASHGWNHTNDSEYFELDIDPKQHIAKIIHITAQKEYRNHFALVETNAALIWRNPQLNSNSLLGKPIGFQYSLPGTHADIGGGYVKQFHDGGEDHDLYFSNYAPLIN